jgi:uncharacterized RDD family membrane protein YckC
VSNAPPDPRREETEEEHFSVLDGYCEELHRGGDVDPEQWARSHPGGNVEELRVLRALRDAAEMTLEDSRVDAPDPDATRSLEPGAVMAPAGAPVPDVVGRYRLLRRLGVGGMGEVFEAEDGATGSRVAVKLIGRYFDASLDNVERFRREGRLASTITDPRCVFVLAAEEEAGLPYIVMELMPGDTLKDLVERHGPLAPEEAVRKILDVIDGLSAAHRLQVVHRDVKPSNCFLEADGRVKVGDFGLARPLTVSAALTRTGTFLGTIHYAAPEQFKGAAGMDHRGDVYAVAATLFYLLTGRPPFPDADGATVIARKVSEPAPPLRGLRPDAPAALERVLARGLERDPDRRWRDLAELRQALLPFLPERLAAARISLRVGAVVIDSAVLGLVGGVLALLLVPSVPWLVGLGGVLLNLLIEVAYFTWLEGRWGASLGKRLLRLRVVPMGTSDPPGLLRALVRTLLFQLVAVPWLLLDLTVDRDAVTLLLLLGGWVLGILVLASTMRARNGRRGLHDLLSGTRVVQLPAPEQAPAFAAAAESRRPPAVSPDMAVPQVGPFTIRGTIAAGPDATLYLGEDPVLKRLVWVRLCASAGAATGAVRREVSRPTRLRWLAGGPQGDGWWDAFLAPAGMPLTDLVHPSQPWPWRDVRPVLEQLADELAAAEEDGTLPARLTVAQVWIRSDGRVQLLDTAPASGAVDSRPRGLDLLREVAVLLLEGRPRPPDAAPVPVRAPVPLHARRMLSGLVGAASPYQDVGEFRLHLAATRPLPAEVTSEQRASHLAVLGALLFVGLVFMFMAARFGSMVAIQTIDEQVLATDAWLRALHDARLRPEILGTDPARRFAGGDADRLEEILRGQQDVYQRLVAERRPAVKYTLGVFDLEGHDTEQLLAGPADLERVDGGDFQFRIIRHGPGGDAEPDFYDDGDLQLLCAGWIQDPATARAFMELGLASLLAGTPLKRASVPVPLAVASLWLVIWLVPLLWLVWAFVFRGGVSLRLMGLALVRRNGRPAWRLQCAWRAVLVWVPVVGVLMLATSLDYRSWAPDGATPWQWFAWLSVLTWWAAVGLLIGYGWLAFRRPTRSWHDRLAGTNVVPR